VLGSPVFHGSIRLEAPGVVKLIVRAALLGVSASIKARLRASSSTSPESNSSSLTEERVRLRLEVEGAASTEYGGGGEGCRLDGVIGLARPGSVLVLLARAFRSRSWA
jgi:hypothetical protein